MSYVLSAYADSTRITALEMTYGTRLESLAAPQKYLLLNLLTQYCFVQFDGEPLDPDFTHEACLALSQLGQHADEAVAAIWLTLEGAEEAEFRGLLLAVASQLFDGEYARLHPKSAALQG